MPYIYSGPWRLAKNRHDVYKKQTKSSTFRNGDRATQGLHLPVTLDEYCNPSLNDCTLERRNKDQVVVRDATRRQGNVVAHKRTQSEDLPPDTRLLMIHQLWVYRFDKHHVLAFPDIVLQEPTIRQAVQHRRYVFPDSKEDDVHLMSMLRIAEWLFAFIGLIETPAGLLDPNDEHVSLDPRTNLSSRRSVLDIYEESISVLSDDVDMYFEKSVKEQEKAADAEKQYFHEISDIREELSMIRIVVAQQEQVWTELKEEIESYCTDAALMARNGSPSIYDAKQIAEKLFRKEVRSGDRWHTPIWVADELFSRLPAFTLDEKSEFIDKIADALTPLYVREFYQTKPEAEATVKEFFTALQRIRDRKSNNIAEAQTIIMKLSRQLAKLKDRIGKADQNAERVQSLIPQYLELKRSATSMKEAHHAAVLGAAVVGFSVVTILFTPMSFILALLALPESSFLIRQATRDEKSEFLRLWTGMSDLVSWLYLADGYRCDGGRLDGRHVDLDHRGLVYLQKKSRASAT